MEETQVIFSQQKKAIVQIVIDVLWGRMREEVEELERASTSWGNYASTVIMAYAKDYIPPKVQPMFAAGKIAGDPESATKQESKLEEINNYLRGIVDREEDISLSAIFDKFASFSMDLSVRRNLGDKTKIVLDAVTDYLEIFSKLEKKLITKGEVVMAFQALLDAKVRGYLRKEKGKLQVGEKPFLGSYIKAVKDYLGSTEKVERKVGAAMDFQRGGNLSDFAEALNRLVRLDYFAGDTANFAIYINSMAMLLKGIVGYRQALGYSEEDFRAIFHPGERPRIENREVLLLGWRDEEGTPPAEELSDYSAAPASRPDNM